MELLLDVLKYLDKAALNLGCTRLIPIDTMIQSRLNHAIYAGLQKILSGEVGLDIFFVVINVLTSLEKQLDPFLSDI